jgi:exodeoxyribonuclease VII large subunit
MQLLAGRLDALSPLATLARGYAVARTADGRAVASVGQLPPDTSFELLLRDGRVRATSNTTEAGAPASFLTSGSGP